METTPRVQILDEAVCVFLCTNPPGGGKHKFISSPMCRLGSFRNQSKKQKNFIKIDLVSYPVYNGGVGYTLTHNDFDIHMLLCL